MSAEAATLFYKDYSAVASATDPGPVSSAPLTWHTMFNGYISLMHRDAPGSVHIGTDRPLFVGQPFSGALQPSTGAVTLACRVGLPDPQRSALAGGASAVPMEDVEIDIPADELGSPLLKSMQLRDGAELCIRTRPSAVGLDIDYLRIDVPQEQAHRFLSGASLPRVLEAADVAEFVRAEIELIGARMPKFSRMRAAGSKVKAKTKAAASKLRSKAGSAKRGITRKAGSAKRGVMRKAGAAKRGITSRASGARRGISSRYTKLKTGAKQRFTKAGRRDKQRATASKGLGEIAAKGKADRAAEARQKAAAAKPTGVTTTGSVSTRSTFSLGPKQGAGATTFSRSTTATYGSGAKPGAAGAAKPAAPAAPAPGKPGGAGAAPASGKTGVAGPGARQAKMTSAKPVAGTKPAAAKPAPAKPAAAKPAPAKPAAEARRKAAPKPAGAKPAAAKQQPQQRGAASGQGTGTGIAAGLAGAAGAAGAAGGLGAGVGMGMGYGGGGDEDAYDAGLGAGAAAQPDASSMYMAPGQMLGDLGYSTERQQTAPRLATADRILIIPEKAANRRLVPVVESYSNPADAPAAGFAEEAEEAEPVGAELDEEDDMFSLADHAELHADLAHYYEGSPHLPTMHKINEQLSMSDTHNYDLSAFADETANRMVHVGSDVHGVLHSFGVLDLDEFDGSESDVDDVDEFDRDSVYAARTRRTSKPVPPSITAAAAMAANSDIDAW
jgi:hypothetical protein